MNSFALLQDDVEDASDLSPSVSKIEEKKVVEERPAESVQDAHAAPEVQEVKDGGEKKDDKDNKDKEDKPKPPPKEKEMSLEEYLAKKAQMSIGLASLNSKGVRKANDGAGFERMSVLKKVDKDETLDGVPVKEVHENKALKDSTHAAVAKNAEIQSFFKRDTGGDRRGGRGRGDGRRTGYDRGGRGRGGGGDGRYNGRMERDYRRDQRGGFGRNNGGREDSHGGHNRYGNGPDVPIAPNVDDTAAFPSL